MLEAEEGGAPVVGDGGAGGGGGVEAGHHGLSHTFHIAGLCVVDALLQDETVLRDVPHGSGHGERFVEVAG